MDFWFFRMLVNILQCDVMLLMMQTVLERAIDLKARSFSESHLQKVRGSFFVASNERSRFVFSPFLHHSRRFFFMQILLF